ncbi:MAG TPA: GPW/gp25 family protein [Kouleothrix sp.]|uniref:GPW/gp25 family protein n=1 Tax=Kouleothrix sp. TaxID=2779161 RepID=UPI002B5E4870|nr:GPW/gp25 family protein [Kouleothrix sp.]HRC74438.1 GPW/gp25 family protein [Kouleothrix sp.]
MRSYDLIGSGWRFPIGIGPRGGIALASDADELEQAMLLILSTPKRQRLMRPEFGCQIHDLLFAPLNTSTLTAAEHYVREALAWWEPRVEIIDVLADPAANGNGVIKIAVRYIVKSTHDERSLVYPFYTIPGEP